MKLIDFDGLFDEKLTQYMSENKNKHTEKEWENVIPKLYKKFGKGEYAKHNIERINYVIDKVYKKQLRVYNTNEEKVI